MTTTKSDRVIGSLYGLALGDAYGYQVEFTQFPKILSRYGAIGPEFPRRARVSDDTQMALALWYGLDTADLTDAASVAAEVGREFLTWAVDPDNTRAPGMTCLSALARLQDGRHWTRASIVESKGCGTVMRAPWIGLHPRVASYQVSDIAQLTAAMTHGHPTAVVAADVLAQLTRDLADGEIDISEVVAHAAHLVQRVTYSPWLGDLYEVAGYDSPAAYVEHGRAELDLALGRIRVGVEGMLRDPFHTDPCTFTGEGWTADEALATALLVIRLWGNQPQLAVRRASTTGGDSDSLAAIAGALLGAAHGADAWDTWPRHLEPRYRRELAAVRAQVETEDVTS